MLLGPNANLLESWVLNQSTFKSLLTILDPADEVPDCWTQLVSSDEEDNDGRPEIERYKTAELEGFESTGRGKTLRYLALGVAERLFLIWAS